LSWVASTITPFSSYAIAIIARAVEVESRYLKAIPAAMPRHAGDRLPRLAISV
jgi:hypothetical protein